MNRRREGSAVAAAFAQVQLFGQQLVDRLDGADLGLFQAAEGLVQRFWVTWALLMA